MSRAAAGALEAIDRVLNRGGVVDHVLCRVALILVERGGCTYAAVARHEAGFPTGEVVSLPIAFQGAQVGELVVAPPTLDRAFLERVATVVSAYRR